MESSNTVAQGIEYFFDNLDFATLESDKNFQPEEFNSEEDITDEECEKISQEDQPHGNTGRSPKITLSTETVDKAKSFIIAVRKYTRKNMDGKIIVTYEKHDSVFLPSHYSYRRLLVAYNLLNPNNLIKSHRTFQKIWKSDLELGKIAIRKPSKDMCDECTLFKRALKENNNNVDEDLDMQLLMHINDYRSIRDAYEDDIRTAKICDRSLFRVFSFDFVQDVELPHDPQQPEKWYYLSLLKAHQFGLVDEGIDTHWHAIYTEGKASKGANEVASIVHLFLTSAAGEAKKIQLWADNCGGLSEEKQVDLWDKIRPYCPIAFHDELCPKPQDNVLERVRNLKAVRAKEIQSRRITKRKQIDEYNAASNKSRKKDKK
ncbi:7479_t:CDS:2 [Racocetra fulgida]|uniref:7479_t:CDS:1 n=1 Tax=Racocetra fulgida TaxID=60492 RepID=A0A9N9CMV8_9GLOM|nr:7479_t:CDS:2 [Racocetra fulgida]